MTRNSFWTSEAKDILIIPDQTQIPEHSEKEEPACRTPDEATSESG
jgi:hypothetical protein